MLTRENMLNGTFVRVHEALLPANMLWDAEKSTRINELYSGGAPDGCSCLDICLRVIDVESRAGD